MSFKMATVSTFPYLLWSFFFLNDWVILCTYLLFLWKNTTNDDSTGSSIYLTTTVLLFYSLKKGSCYLVSMKEVEKQNREDG